MMLIGHLAVLLFAILGVSAILSGLDCLSYKCSRGWLSCECRRRGISWLIVGSALLFSAGFLIASFV